MRLLALATVFGLASFSAPLLAHSHQHGHSVAVDTALFDKATETQVLTVEQCWLRLLPSHLPAAGYLTLRNTTAQPVQVLAARSPSYEQIMLHETIEVDGMSTMQMVDHLEVAAHQQLDFKPGGLHLMLSEPTASLQVGNTITLEVLLADQQKITTQCKLNDAKARQYD